MRQNLTDLSIKRLKPHDDRYDVWDAKVSNLGVRVFPTGVKSFFLSYYHHKHKRRDTLGRYPELSLAEARHQAYDRKSSLMRGEDPQISSQGTDFQAVLDQFLNLYCARHNKPSTQNSTKKLLENECLPKWKTKPVDQITRADIIAVLDAMVTRGSAGAANNCYAAISKFFNWSLSRGLIDVNPCASIQRPSKRNTRDRVLSDEEVKAVWGAAKQVGFPFGTIVHLLLATAARRSEITTLTWDKISDETIHIADTKTHQPHYLPITPLIAESIEGVPHTHDNVFPARGVPNNSFSGFSKCKKRLDKLCPMPYWTLHDLRRTAATHMAELGVQPHVIERVLNHATGTISGIAAIYNRHAYSKEMREALTLWHDKIQRLVAS